ncbi:MAG TPA: hypothetical protein VHO03_15980 [Ignavibacteriales bacterium]|nr:hypothetical protein [Ignavibacteriales bacterium]
MQKSIIAFLFLSLILLWGCKHPAPFKSKKDLIGQWKGTVVDVTTPNRLRASFPFRKYGLALFELNRDSSFSYTIEINRDVILEKEVLGNPLSKTLIKAVYKRFQKGRFSAGDSTLTLNDPDNNEISRNKYYFNDRTLYTEFVGKDKLTWLIAWEKN